MTNNKTFCAMTVLVLSFALTPPTVWAARDSLEAKVSDITPAHVALTAGGVDLAPDTYSPSQNIKLSYVLEAFNFPAGITEFGTFNLGLRIVDNSGSNPTNPQNTTVYSRRVSVFQQGGGDSQLLLVPSPHYFDRGGPGDFGPSAVTISTDCTGGCPTDDGSQLVRSLMFEDTGDGVGLANSINGMQVQVEITLVHPTQCRQLYNFLTDQDLTTSVESTDVVVVKNGRNAGKVNATTPFGQFSSNVLVTSTCEAPEYFDLKINLDPSFDTNPNGNPGNAVFTHVAGTAVDPETFNINDFYLYSAEGQSLCLSNVTVAAGASLLATVHMGIRRGEHMDDLTASPFVFSAQIFESESGCEGDALDTDAAEMSYGFK
jgi:hypothetical protein